ncbi:hypothetical protein [Vibrio sp. WXL210]|uniref:hypothetical protein n=1 Tax=Vibrio sp. WXL210 TaxID=3450709 RepID=UPI003EC5E462
MSTTYGTCDWCKQRRRLKQLNYLDGKYHHSCEECMDLARLDVQLFNQGEQAYRERMLKKAS